MIVLLQRVLDARVEVNQLVVGQIQQGLLVFVGFEPQDEPPQVLRLLEKVLNYRVFADADGKMNLSLMDIDGGLLLVPQFTLAADTNKGRRPSFTAAAEPRKGHELFDFLCRRATLQCARTACGRFGADMQVFLQNDGPVTFILNQ